MIDLSNQPPRQYIVQMITDKGYIIRKSIILQ
jgi:hypothetical protein